MSAEGGELFCPLDHRYGRDEVRALFLPEARLRRALLVEAALAEGEAELGMIPADAAKAIGRAARGGTVSLVRVEALERELSHDVMAITRALAEAAGEGGAWVHFGATSADITDSALALELKDSAAILRKDLTALARALLALAEKHAGTAQVGRTHGQHALPLSFGYKMAGAAAEVLRHRRRLDELTPRLTVGKMAGAVGTGAGFGAKAAELELEVMKRLGIGTDEAPTQVVSRDRLAELTNLLALVAGTAERLSTEVRNLQRTEIAEVAEAFDEARQVGSSTMAQKRNPRLSENVTSLARMLRALALPPLENMVLWHERDLANSANERIVIPHAVLLADDILTKLTDVFTHLEVDPDRMQANLQSSRGTVMTERLMLALTEKGVARSEAHELLRKLTRDSSAGPSLRERASAEPTVKRLFPSSELSELLDPMSYVKAAEAKTRRVVRALSEEIGR
ncbi:MAG: adenylosuccinate lyase [Thermoplasmata archaeon]|nr:adenylosuccinate lyase [Thermoplasmata archaeon]